MVNYDGFRSVIQYSLDELSHIANYLQERERPESPTTVLIGGWAVHSYNPWYGSIDIDLITNSRTRHSLKDYLVSDRGFDRVRSLDDTKRVEKRTPSGKSIVIDFGTRDQNDPFEGQECHIVYGILDGQTESRTIGEGVSFPVPKRSVLLLFKLKAAWDREHRILNGTSHDTEWELGKVRKDRADILALLDPKKGGHEVDFSFLGKKLDEYPFLKMTLAKIGADIDAIDFYGRLERNDAKNLLELVMDQIE